MDLDRLSEFVVIAQSGSFKQAGETLGLAPNVVSTRLRAFEASLGTDLISCSAHHFALTEHGRFLYENAHSLLSGYSSTVAAVKNLQGSTFQSLRLLLCAQLVGFELGPFLDRYCRRNPGLFLGLYDENTCKIREGLLSGEADIAFAVGRPDDFTDIPGRIQMATFPRMKVIVPNDHPLVKKRKISFSDLAGETFILYPRMLETFTRDLQLSIIRQSGIPFHIYEEDYSPYFFDLLVPIGKGIRLWNWNARVTPNTTVLTLQDSGYETALFMLYRPESSNAAVHAFVEAFTAYRKERR